MGAVCMLFRYGKQVASVIYGPDPSARASLCLRIHQMLLSCVLGSSLWVGPGENWLIYGVFFTCTSSEWVGLQTAVGPHRRRPSRFITYLTCKKDVFLIIRQLSAKFYNSCCRADDRWLLLWVRLVTRDAISLTRSKINITWVYRLQSPTDDLLILSRDPKKLKRQKSQNNFFFSLQLQDKENHSATGH